jgi:hypothetical protein
MSTSEALSGVGEASAEVADEIDVSKRGRSASLVKRARWAWRYVSIRAVTALDMVLTACTFGVLGRDRVQRWSRRLSLVSTSGGPPTGGRHRKLPAGQIIFGEPHTPQRPFRWRTWAHRAVIVSTSAEVPKRVRRLQRLRDLEIRFDTDFDAITEGCRQGRSGWLTGEVVEIYRELYELGFVATIGAYREGDVVAGL